MIGALLRGNVTKATIARSSSLACQIGDVATGRYPPYFVVVAKPDVSIGTSSNSAVSCARNASPEGGGRPLGCQPYNTSG